MCLRCAVKNSSTIWHCRTKTLPLQAEVLQITTKDMETTTIRRPASFRLRADLLEGLKRNAARTNRSLNNYVDMTRGKSNSLSIVGKRIISKNSLTYSSQFQPYE